MFDYVSAYICIMYMYVAIQQYKKVEFLLKRKHSKD